MRSYFLKLSGREEGPHSDAQIAQMFSDQRVNRSTPYKPEVGGDWRTVDDYMPTLKYGTQLPSPTDKTPTAAIQVGLGAGGGNVKITDIDVPFGSVLKMAFKVRRD